MCVLTLISAVDSDWTQILDGLECFVFFSHFSMDIMSLARARLPKCEWANADGALTMTFDLCRTEASLIARYCGLITGDWFSLIFVSVILC